MKLFYNLFISIIFSSLFSILSFSQVEIKNYAPPDVSEGSNLYLNSSPYYVNTSGQSGDDHKELLLNLDAVYTKWRFTRKLVYAGYAHTSMLFDRYSSSSYETDKYTRMMWFSDLHGGIDYYLGRSLFYTGIYDESAVQFGNHQAPYSSTHVFPHIGYGYIVNAERVTETQNIERVLADAKLITLPLSASVKKKLTGLLDRRNNNEFTDKYKDNADIEFFTELEKLLLDDGVIKSPMSSRTALEIFQKLTNSKFVYFPKYKGYQVQSEFEFNTSKIEGNTYKVFSSFVLSGIYGLPSGLRTSFVGVASLEFPFTDVIGYYNYHFPFHSPIAIQEDQEMQDFFPNLIPSPSGIGNNYRYTYLIGTNAFIFYNPTSTAGISGNLGFTAARKSG